MNTLMYLTLTLCFHVREFKSSGDCKHIYSIVIDGGSSGTRLNVFKFDGNLQNPIINQTFIFKTKVALSSFSNYREDWSLMRVMLTNLTNNALSVVPNQCVRITPCYLQVTAGIRQIEQRIGSRILTNIRHILSKSPFNFRNNFVNTLSTTMEGELAWISINFLMDLLQSNPEKPKETVGVLDLGGGSTQIAFATEHPDLIKKSNTIRVLGRNYSIYARGYDYMGINEARIKYFNAQACCQTNCKGKLFRSQCLHPSISTEYMVGNKTLLIGGKIIRNSRRFCHCFAKGLQCTKVVTSIREFFGKKPFLAFSAYYYVLKAAGSIFKVNSNGMFQTNIRDIIIRTMEICRTPFVSSKSSRYSHFLCMDLSYIVALLHNGYGFEWYDELTSTMKIKDIGLSWALGYAILKL